jgi:uncharacterized protein
MSDEPKHIESLILKELGKRKGLVAAAGLTGLGVLAYSFLAEPHWLEITHHRVKVPDLPPEWEGFRIAWLSDLHLRHQEQPYRGVREAFALVVAEKPDLAILGGDSFDRGMWFEEAGKLLATLPQAGIKTLAIMGNHDYFANRGSPSRIARELANLNIRMLVNEAICLERDGVAKWLVAIDDYSKGIPDLHEATRNLPPDVKPLLFLSHNPKMIRKLPPNFCDLALAGHTHGGQINPALPPFKRELNWIKWVKGDMGSPFPQGWYTVNGNPLYVGRGIGTTRYPVRFNARPELPIFELTKTS